MRLPPIRVGRSAPQTLIDQRARAVTSRLADTNHPGVEVSQEELGGVACVVCRPATPRGAIVYLHGGGFRSSSALAYGPFCSHLAAWTSATVYAVEYRLAPEHPFPAGLTDARDVYLALAGQGVAPMMAGDSAGGGLAASTTALVLQDGKVAPPVGLLLISSLLDLRLTAPSLGSRAQTDRIFSAKQAAEAAELYLQGAPVDDPLVSPVLADLTGFPPTQIMVGSAEILLDDSLAFARGLAHHGVQADVHIGPGAQHVWFTRGMAPPAHQAEALIIRHFADRLWPDA